MFLPRSIWNASDMGAPGVAELGSLGKKGNVLPREASPTIQTPTRRESDLGRLAPVGARDEALIDGLNESRS